MYDKDQGHSGPDGMLWNGMCRLLFLSLVEIQAI